ncbi:kinase-like protein [Xylariaceae sp. FL0255]|nr:kinase-like protein [Xylariaceae sp. FL0255]
MSSSNTTSNLITEEPQPLRSAMRQDEDTTTDHANGTSSIKAVQIAEPEPEPVNPEETLPRKQFSAGLARRLSGRSPVTSTSSLRPSLLSQTSSEAMASSLPISQSPQQLPTEPAQSHHRHRHRLDHVGERLIAQVAEWLEHERIKKQNRASRRMHSSRRRPQSEEVETEAETSGSLPSTSKARSYSIDSQSSEVSLERLQKIIDDSMSSLGLNAVPPYSPKSGRKQQKRRSLTLHKTVSASSDTEWYDGDILVPSCDAILDNTKTLSYTMGSAEAQEATQSSSKHHGDKERKAWITFKNEIIRLAHTLRLKGWRRVPLDGGNLISVIRLSGAMTNAIYVVNPPDKSKWRPNIGRKSPAKLLLRVYGPHVEHIIDRENELNVLRRLARKKIGPRLLGTFANGRFEQYLDAITLTAEDLRDPDTSKQIAKRMRELHDGIELLQEEKDGGPNVLKNWDSWVDRVSQTMTYLDEQFLIGKPGPFNTVADAWKEHGFVCGTDWPTFMAMVYKYRQYILERYGNSKVVRDHLIFSHNDTQYGNILRVRPEDKKSPLLQPHYEHKQLVVIDFEYSGPNVRGLEFANHFTEWCYNYHDETADYVCDHRRYPTPEEQYRFVKAYVTHRPEFPHPKAQTPVLTPLATPTMGPTTPAPGATTPGAASTSSIVEFMLDARVPPGGWKETEKIQTEQTEEQIKALIEETQLWRTINSAQWVAWGVMQAKIPGFNPEATTHTAGTLEVPDGANGAAPAEEEEEAGSAEFNYLGYAQDRAFFFWGDCVQKGLVKMGDLPERLQKKIKVMGC